MALTVSEVAEVCSKNDDPLPDPPPSDVPLTTTVGDPSPRPYVIEDGLRRVAPYYYTYNTFCKQRWRDRTLLDIFASEFRDRTAEYYKGAIIAGRVVVDGRQVPQDYVLKNGEVISHTLHRHEPPVTGQPIRVVNEDDDMIVIDKPAGVPVHPAGRYSFNSVVEIMRAERHCAFNPLPCNRLDRLTSGVMFIGKDPVAAEAISQKLRGRTVRKEYLARVRGRFPDGDENGVTVCEENVMSVSPILGLNRVRASGKSAKTLFKRVAYYPGSSQRRNKDQCQPADAGIASQTGAAAPAPPSVEDDGYSIVHCLPLTGRTHQLRVHLQFLGHPIANDPIYSNRRVFGHLLGKNDASDEHDKEIIARLSAMGKTESFASTMGTETTPSTPPTNTTASTLPSLDTPAGATTSELESAYAALVDDYNRTKGEKMTGERCKECDTPLYSDPGPNELGIYLHAICYRDLEGKWSYQSPVPEWAWPPAADDGEEDSGSREPTGIRTFSSWDDAWSAGLMEFDRETVVPNGGKLKGHQ